MAYIGYTATPVANLVNEENSGNPLAPDFLYSMAEPQKYFGFRKIFGESQGEFDANTNMRIVEEIPEGELPDFDPEDDGEEAHFNVAECPSLVRAISWLFCTAAARHLNRGVIECGTRNAAKQWTTMLLNIDQRQRIHRTLQIAIYKYLSRIRTDSDFRDQFLAGCETVWNELTGRFSREEFVKACPDYLGSGDADEGLGYPEWNRIKEVLSNYFFTHLSSGVANPDRELDLGRVHVVTINSRGSHGNEPLAYDGKENLRKYTGPEDSESHIWILCGGNTISRGLTLEGLTVSYFDRLKQTSPVDMITQMGRWFGYRQGYELLPRVWMPHELVIELKKMCHLEMKLHEVIGDGFLRGDSPKNSEHRLEVLSYGDRPLSGRAAAYQITSCGFNQASDSFKQLNSDIDVRSDMLNKVAKFLAQVSQYRDRVSGIVDQEFRKYPYFKNVPSRNLVELGRDIVNLYPAGNSKMSAEAFFREVSRSNQTWDVVVNNPDTKMRCGGWGNDLAQMHVATTQARSAAGLMDLGKVSNTAFRGNFSRVDSRILSLAECDLIERYVADPLLRELPQGFSSKDSVLEHLKLVRDNQCQLDHSLREYFKLTRMTGDAYREAVFSRPEMLKARPILQITLFAEADNANVGRENPPYVVLSFYWPHHTIDGYFSGKVGLDEVVIDDFTLSNLIREILEERHFMHEETLKEELERRTGLQLDASVYRSALAYRNNGYRILENKPEPCFRSGTFYSVEWCASDAQFLEHCIADIRAFATEYRSLKRLSFAIARDERFACLLRMNGKEEPQKVWWKWILNHDSELNLNIDYVG